MRVYLAYIFHDYYFPFLWVHCIFPHGLYHFSSSISPFFNYIDQIIYSHVMIWTLEMFAHWLSFVMKRWHLLLFFFFNGASVFLASLINFSLIFELMAINSWYFPDQTLFCSVNCMDLYIIYCFSSKGWTVFFICHVSCIYNIKSIKKTNV